MKIIRNGNETELTWTEMREAYEAVRREYLREDIKCKAEEMECELTNKRLEKVVNMVEKSLSNNDSYWESYWMTIEYVINEY